MENTMFKTVLRSYILLFAFVSGSHFRGGYITWRPLSNAPPPEGSFPRILFSYRVSWTSATYPCDQQTIDDMTTIIGEGDLECEGCDDPDAVSFDFICTDFNVQDGWTSGVGSASFTPNRNEILAYYRGGAWISFQNGGGGSWSLQASVNLEKRSDNDRLNTSPVTSTFPVVPVALNCPSTITIPVVDVDGDIVRCRYAEGDSECASACIPLPGATFEGHNCNIQWTPTADGLYAVAVQIEDYMDSSSSTPLSSIPLQFILEVSSFGSCSDAPTFASDVLAAGSCVVVSQERPFATRITANVADASQSIVAINTLSPSGLITTQVQPVPGSDTEYFIDAQFTAGPQTQALELFCFVALTNSGFPSEQRCVTIATDVPKPLPLAASVDKNNIVTVTIDRMVRRTDTSGSVDIVYAANHRLVYRFDVSTSEFVTFADVTSYFKIQLPLPLLTCEKYLLRLDGGVVETLEDCPAGNDSVDLPLIIEKQRPKKKFCF